MNKKFLQDINVFKKKEPPKEGPNLVIKLKKSLPISQKNEQQQEKAKKNIEKVFHKKKKGGGRRKL